MLCHKLRKMCCGGSESVGWCVAACIQYYSAKHIAMCIKENMKTFLFPDKKHIYCVDFQRVI